MADQEFIKQGDYNQKIIRDRHKAIEWYNKVLAIDENNVEALSKKAKHYLDCITFHKHLN